MRKCIACGREYPNTRMACEDCGIALGAPIEIKKNKPRGVAFDSLGDAHGICILFQIVLIGWCGYCMYWWFQMDKFLKVDFWEQRIDYPEFMPRMLDIGQYFGLFALILLVYQVVALLGVLTFRTNAGKMATYGFLMMATLHVVLMMVCEMFVEGANDDLVRAFLKYDSKTFWIITIVIYVLGLLCHCYYKHMEYAFTKSWAPPEE